MHTGAADNNGDAKTEAESRAGLRLAQLRLCFICDVVTLCAQAKQKAMEELTQGQAMTLVRNEQVIDRSAEEAEDLEEMLNESIVDSLRGAKQKAAGQKEEKKKKRCCPSLLAQVLLECLWHMSSSRADAVPGAKQKTSGQAAGRSGECCLAAPAQRNVCF